MTLCLGAILLSAFTLANSVGPAQLEKLQTELAQVKSSLLKSDEEQKKAARSLTQINARLKTLVQKRGKTERERQGLEANIKDLAAKILDLQNKNKEMSGVLRKRVRGLTQFSAPSFLQLLLTSKNAADLERNLKILGKIAAKDLELLKEFSSRERDLQQKQKIFIGRLEHLRKLEQNLILQTKNINRDSNFKLAIVNRERSRKKGALERLKFLIEKINKSSGVAVVDSQADNYLQLLTKTSFFEKKGELPHPIDPGSAQILASFGVLKDPDYDVLLAHRGIRFALQSVGREALPVRSVHSGNVAFADLIPGVGKAIIIDHGDFYYSVYTGDLDTHVKVADYVKEGERIAAAESELYFEIRHFSEPYDPAQWLKGWQQ